MSLSTAGRLFPGHRGGVAVSPSTVFRWVTKGTRSSAGQVVRLDAVRVGGRWLTSRGAVKRFVAALTDNSIPGACIYEPVPRSPVALAQAAEKAEAALRAMGA
ncbi:DUF1580 domain-containing protein [Limnoglobus roseus]|uniref:DUF1580 domain-containing protein n=1 Tax=Limnoglobus roseus TaxID=2598579 RepID=UPI00143D4CE9|nr:DUF1580 domain-containing protein [Limnoglobus roseus]